MDLAAFNAEMTNDPEELGYAGKTDEQLWTLLSTKNRSRLKEYRLTELGVYALLAGDPAAAETFLSALEAYAEAAQTYSPLVARMLPWTKPGAPGLDFGNAALVTILQGLATAEVLNATTVNTLVAAATESVSRLQEINCGDADKKECIHELYAMGFDSRDPANAPPKV